MPPLAGTLAAPSLWASLRPPVAQSHCFLMQMVILVNAFRMAPAESLLRHPSWTLGRDTMAVSAA